MSEDKKNKLFQYFGGKYVSVIMRSIKGRQQLDSGSTIEGNVILEGYFLDQDDEHYFLGKDPAEIDDALIKEDLVRMFIGEEVVEFMEFDVEDTGDRH